MKSIKKSPSILVSSYDKSEAKLNAQAQWNSVFWFEFLLAHLMLSSMKALRDLKYGSNELWSKNEIKFIPSNISYLKVSYARPCLFYTVQILTHLSIIKILWVGVLTIHILQMRSLRQSLHNVLKDTQLVSKCWGRMWTQDVYLQSLCF